MVSSPARMGARPNLRRRILRTTLFLALAIGGDLGSGLGAGGRLGFGCGLGGVALEDGAGLGLGYGLFGLGGVLAGGVRSHPSRVMAGSRSSITISGPSWRQAVS